MLYRFCVGGSSTGIHHLCLAMPVTVSSWNALRDDDSTECGAKVWQRCMEALGTLARFSVLPQIAVRSKWQEKMVEWFSPIYQSWTKFLFSSFCIHRQASTCKKTLHTITNLMTERYGIFRLYGYYKQYRSPKYWQGISSPFSM